MLEYPEQLLRGIADERYIDKDGRASAQLFQFDDNTARLDGFDEASINWYDDENAIKILMGQKKQKDPNTHQFKGGVAVLSKKWLDDTIARPNVSGTLHYERQKIDQNPYHGNILRKSGLDKMTNTVLSAAIATCVERIEIRDSE